MTLSMLLAPAAHAASHNPVALAHAEIERHAVLTHADTDHGHGHEDGWPAERHAGHAHGHNPADHSHDVPAPVAFAGCAFPIFAGAWLPVAPRSHDCGPSFGIERPPRI